MGRFTLHTEDTAPEGSKETLRAIEQEYGFVPNLMREFAEAPAALNGYLAVSGHFENSSLSPAEQQLVLLSVAVENRCHYCVAVHSAGALRAGASRQAVDAFRDGDRIRDERLQALRTFTQAVVRQRGWLDDGVVEAFLEAGFENRQVLEVLTGVMLKTLSNYTNHIADTPLDDAFADHAWDRDPAGLSTA